MNISNIFAREILDSNGFPTIEAQVTLEDGSVALGQVPTGASTGKFETFELRDNDNDRYFGKGVLKAISNINGPIKKALTGKDAFNQKTVDESLIGLDGTKNKSNLGGNAILGVSMAVCRASARSQKIPLYEYLGKLTGNDNFQLPQPLMLVLEGGKHGNWATDLQEFFVIPKSDVFQTFSERLRVGVEIYYSLKKILEEKKYSTGVGFEGAFMPKELSSNEEAIELLIKAVNKAGFIVTEQVSLGIDAASNEFYKDGKYLLKSEDLVLLKSKWFTKVTEWTKKYPLWLMEDMFAEEDWESWIEFTKQFGDSVQIVGDDLLTTNIERIQNAIENNAVNSVVIKPNQIGTISETVEAIKLSHSAGYSTIISHRGGETNDDFIADLCVGSGSAQCKFGAPNRGERIAKYNRLLRIEERLSF